MEDLIMCITSGGQKMVREDYSVPLHHMKPKSALKKWPVLASEKNQFQVAPLPDIITQLFEEIGNAANKNNTSTLEG